MVGNIIIVLTFVVVAFLITLGIHAQNILEHLSKGGVLICKDANSSFLIKEEDIMVGTDRFYMRIKPKGQTVSYFDCEKK